VHAPIFLRSFASDRRHMKDSGGKWVEEPPPHEPIVAEGNDWEISIGNWTCLALT